MTNRLSFYGFLAGCMVLGFFACESSLPKDQAHFAKGFKAYESGDFYTALLYLKPLVEEGHPAAELLLAKMYSNGQGVQQDVGKAELLRNLAAAKIYSKPLPPGEVIPANSTLKAVQDRLDYYTEGPSSKRAPSVQDISQLLTSLDLNGIKQLASTDLENATPQEKPPATQEESAPPAEVSAPSPAPAAAEKERTAPPVETEPQAIDLQNSRKADSISLGLLLRSAEDHDLLAMQLLSTAYAKGYYGVTPNPKLAAMWRKRAIQARHGQPSGAEEDEPEASMPVGALVGVCLIGLGLIGSGIWMKKRKRA